MRRAAALAAALLVAWAVLRARRARPQPTGWTEPEDGVPPVDVYVLRIASFGSGGSRTLVN